MKEPVVVAKDLNGWVSAVADMLVDEVIGTEETATFAKLRAVLDAIDVMLMMQLYADAEHERRLDALNHRLLPGEAVPRG